MSRRKKEPSLFPVAPLNEQGRLTTLDGVRSVGAVLVDIGAAEAELAEAEQHKCAAEAESKRQLVVSEAALMAQLHQLRQEHAQRCRLAQEVHAATVRQIERRLAQLRNVELVAAQGLE